MSQQHIKENKCCEKCKDKSEIAGIWKCIGNCLCHTQPQELSECCGAVPQRLDIEIVCSACGKPFSPKVPAGGKCTDECKNLGNHGHCLKCGLFTQPIMKCKCPERQNGNWVSSTPEPPQGDWEEKLEKLKNNLIISIRTYQHSCISGTEEEEKFYKTEIDKAEGELKSFIRQTLSKEREAERQEIIKFIEDNLIPADAKNSEGIAYRHMAKVIRNYIQGRSLQDNKEVK